MNLAALLRAEGVSVVEEGGWQHRARPGEWHAVGTIWHHTAGHKDLQTVINGRADLAGPLANIYLDKTGAAHLVSAGRCNHAGSGAGIVLARVRRDLAPIAPAAQLGLVDDASGNAWFFGVEMENYGDGIDPWPDVQLDAAYRIGAALCRTHGWSANRNIGHLEWSRRKPDPRGFPMSELRAGVADRLHPKEDDLTPEQAKLLETLVADVAAIKAQLTTGAADVPPVGALVAETNARTKRQGVDLGKIKAALKVSDT